MHSLTGQLLNKQRQQNVKYKCKSMASMQQYDDTSCQNRWNLQVAHSYILSK